VSFGVLIQGTKIILLKMKLDIDKGLYMYYEQQPFILPTTNDTYAHMEIALEVITKFKEQMLNSLLRVEDYDYESIWNRYKPYVRPTVSSFEPIYYKQ
ncbi:hypothetical protein CU098_009569, partial [Rhizopus stolonifer]